MEASSFRSLAAVNGALRAPPSAVETIDSRKASEVYASMRSTAQNVAENRIGSLGACGAIDFERRRDNISPSKSDRREPCTRTSLRSGKT
jgi:hypothetical protein